MPKSKILETLLQLQTEKRHQFDLLFFRRLFRLSKLMFPSWSSLTSLLFVTLLAIQLLLQYIIYQVGQIPSQYFLVLGQKNLSAFQQLAWVSILIILANSFVKSASDYISAQLYIVWRRNIGESMHSFYWNENNFYETNVKYSLIDNPDQRMTQDIDKMCLMMSNTAATLAISPFTIGYYFYQTYSNTGYEGPLIVLAYFVVGSIINKLLMTPVVNLTYQQEKLEGDFRFKHVSVRVNSEAIAFMRGKDMESKQMDRSLLQLIGIQLRLALVQFPLQFSSNSFSYLGSIVSYLILAFPIFFSTRYDSLTPAELSALISQNAFVTIYLIFCFSDLINLAVDAASIAGHAHRVGLLMDALTSGKKKPSDGAHMAVSESRALLVNARRSSPAGESSLQVENPVFVEEGRPAIRLVDVTLSVPSVRGTDNRVLLRGLNFEVVQGRRVLITGPSGCGKSSLFRLLCDLWSASSGQIERYVPIGPHSLLFVPQEPYLGDGSDSLRQLISYPLRPVGGFEESRKVRSILTTLNLVFLLEWVSNDLDERPAEWRWQQRASRGEQQRIMLARLLFHRAPFALLDESTSALDEEMESLVYKQLQEANITYISVAHRSSIRRFHDVELKLSHDGSWTVVSIEENGDQRALSDE